MEEEQPRKAIHDAIVRLSEGDRTAMKLLVSRLWPLLLSFAQRNVGREADAEDIAQEVLYKLCSRISEFDGKRDGFSWAFGIAGYEILTHRRRVKRRGEVQGELAFLVADTGLPPEESLIADERMSVLNQAMGELSEADRDVLVTWVGADPIASLGPAWRKRKQRAIERLRAVWSSVYGDA